jgi:hypothetical protein
MLLKGLPRAQLFLPAWRARNLALVRQLASKSSGRASNGPSLFEELFPEESHKEKRSSTINGNFQGPVRRVATPNKLVKHIAPQNETSLPLASQTPQVEDHVRELQDASVLVLSNASKSLALSDFLRLSQKGSTSTAGQVE